MNTSKSSLFVTYALLLLVFLATIEFVFNTQDSLFVVELLILLVLIIIGIVVVMGLSSSSQGVWKILMGFYVITFLNMVYLFSVGTPVPHPFLPLILAPIIGFLVALMQNPQEQQETGNGALVWRCY